MKELHIRSKIISILLLFSSFSHAQQEFLIEDIQLYLNEKNPYFYSAVGAEYVNRARELVFEGTLDTQLSLKLDEKNYGATTGNYEELRVLKPLENGLNLFVSYRNAGGTQEQNNIKTGSSGEILTGINIPILPLIHNTNQRKTNIQTARLSTKAQEQVTQLQLLSLYINMEKIYYQLLFQKEIISIEEELLLKAQKNLAFIEREVVIGKRPAIAVLEMESIILNRKKRLFNAKNDFENHKNVFLQYLNISQEEYDAKYTLPLTLPKDISNILSLEEAIDIGIENRPELKKLTYEIEKVRIDNKQNNLKEYPDIDLNLYTNYDVQYKEGYKVTLSLNFPFERSVFKGEAEALKREKMLLNSKKESAEREIRTNLHNILLNIQITKQNILLKEEELILVSKLNDAEEKKYRAGLSNLIFLNQREIKVVETKQGLLKEYYQLREFKLHLEYELGRHPYQQR